MSYYWANLGAHLLVSLILLLIFLWSVKTTQHHRWKKGFLFLMPVVLMIILLVQMALCSIPRILDSTTVLRSTYHIKYGEIESVGSLGNTIVVDGTTYYVNPFSFEMEVGDEVTVKYTPYAHYAYSLEIYESDIQDEE